MKQTIAILCFSIVAFAAAESGYNYPSPAASALPLGPRAPIYSPLQAPPFPNYNAPASAPVPSPHTPNFYAGQNYAHAQAVQQSFAQSQQNSGQSQQNFGQSQQSFGQGLSAQQSFSSAPAPAPISFPEAHSGRPQAPAHLSQSATYQQQQYSQPQYVQPQRQQIVTKDIYIHSAPEEQEESILGDDFSANAPIRKNYRIVFIKAPSQNLKLASNALRNAQSANEEKTVIYVLSKKPDLSEVSAQLQQVQNEQKSSKPEVYFIKYKTQEEAARAQQEIQAQYDALGGSTHVSDEGIAPVSSVTSLRGEGHSGVAIPISQYARAAQQSYSQQNYASSASNNVVSTPSNGYLPVKAKK